MAFYITMLPVQEWILEFRLGYLGRYWSLINAAGLFIGFLLCALIFVPLIINMTKQFAIRSSQFAIADQIGNLLIQGNRANNFNYEKTVRINI